MFSLSRSDFLQNHSPVLAWIVVSILWPALLVTGCGNKAETVSSGPACTPEEIPGVQVQFDLAAGNDFYAFPFPTDLRRKTGEQSGLDLSGYPSPGLSFLQNLQSRYRELAARAKGFSPSTPVYFVFDGAVQESNLPATPRESMEEGSPVFIADVDPASPEYGRRFPLRIRFYGQAGSFHPENLLAMTPFPGFVLRPDTTYAAVVLRSLKGAQGELLGSPLDLQKLLCGEIPDEQRGEEARAAYSLLTRFLREQKISSNSIAAATCFTTGNPVKETDRIHDCVKSLPAPTLSGPLEQTREYETYYVLEGAYSAPQFQKGIPPYFTGGGDMVIDENGCPVEQKTQDIPLALAVPKGRMPSPGWPLMIYIHGTGGVSTQMLDRGRKPASGGPAERGTGPALTFAARGMATAGAALPVNPQRGSLPAFDGYDFYNVLQPPALRDNLRQGMAEHTLFVRMLKELRINPALCPETDPSPAPDGNIGFDGSKLFAMGQSLGSVVLDIWGALEENLVAIIPSGTGAHFGTMALEMRALPTGDVLRVLLKIPGDEALDLFHPFLNILLLAWGPADPVNFAGHFFRDPLPGREAKHVFVSQGFFDSYFPPPSQNAFILAAGLQLVGEPFPMESFDLVAQSAGYQSPRCGIEAPCSRSTVEAMDYLDMEVADYPVTGNIVSGSGTRITGVLVEALEDGIMDGHHISFQLDRLKYQYGCFLRTFLDTGTPVLLQPNDLGADCD